MYLKEKKFIERKTTISRRVIVCSFTFLMVQTFFLSTLIRPHIVEKKYDKSCAVYYLLCQAKKVWWSLSTRPSRTTIICFHIKETLDTLLLPVFIKMIFVKLLDAII